MKRREYWVFLCRKRKSHSLFPPREHAGDNTETLVEFRFRINRMASRLVADIRQTRGSPFKFYSTITTGWLPVDTGTEIRFPFNQQSNPYEAKFTLRNKILSASLRSSGTSARKRSCIVEVEKPKKGRERERERERMRECGATSRPARRGWLREIKVAGCDWSFILRQGRKVRLGNAYVREEAARKRRRRRAEGEMKPLRVERY